VSQDALFDVLERIEAFFQRLEIYPKAAFNQEMGDIITKIMVEVLNVLGIATKEIRQGWTSKLLLYNCVTVDRTFSEKYLKKLIGRTDLEDALKRLDRLTQEEARLVAAQVLNVANTVDDRVQGIADNMLRVDNRVAGIDDRVGDVGDSLKGQVKDVNDQVKDVNDRVKDVGDRVMAVDHKIVAVLDGARYIFDRLSENWFNNNAPRWKSGQGRYATSSR
jgi:hypothetical protein